MASRARVFRVFGGSVILALWIAQPALAQIVVPSGAQWRVGDGTVDAGGADLRIAGQLQVQGGNVLGLRHLDIQSGGGLDNGSGLIRLAGDWRNAGSFAGATGGVEFVDGLGLTVAQIVGNTGFFDASFLSAIGKRYVFAVGSVQSIAGLLGIAGTGALPIQFASSAAGQFAAINLVPGGTQNISHVGVSDVHAIGQVLAPTLSNEGGSGNANGWFGGGGPGAVTTPVPATSPLSLSALIILLAAFCRRRLSALKPYAPGVRS